MREVEDPHMEEELPVEPIQDAADEFLDERDEGPPEEEQFQGPGEPSPQADIEPTFNDEENEPEDHPEQPQEVPRLNLQEERKEVKFEEPQEDDNRSEASFGRNEFNDTHAQKVEQDHLWSYSESVNHQWPAAFDKRFNEFKDRLILRYKQL